MKRILSLILALILITTADISYACTMFSSSEGGKSWAGNNEDWTDPNTKVWFEPSGKDTYGGVYFGFGDMFPQGGMNEKGLFFDAAATKGVSYSSNKPYAGWDLMAEIMRKCLDVDEVVAFYKKYDFIGLHWAQYMYTDKSGMSVIIAGTPDGVKYIHKNGTYQALGNSLIAQGEAPDWKQAVAEKMLKDNCAATVKNFTNILESMDQNGLTKYTNIYDLQRGEVYLYHQQNYGRYIKFNLKYELEKGYKEYDLPELFRVKPEIRLKINSGVMEINSFKNDVDPEKGGKPVIYKNRTLLPINALVEALGGSVVWSKDQKSVKVILNSKIIEMTAGSKKTLVNGRSHITDVGPAIINGIPLVPLRFVMEKAGYSVKWDEKSQRITIS